LLSMWGWLVRAAAPARPPVESAPASGPEVRYQRYVDDNVRTMDTLVAPLWHWRRHADSRSDRRRWWWELGVERDCRITRRRLRHDPLVERDCRRPLWKIVGRPCNAGATLARRCIGVGALAPRPRGLNHSAWTGYAHAALAIGVVDGAVHRLGAT